MLWFIPSWPFSPTQLTASWWNGWENWKSKSERTCGLRWRQPNRESKSCACKQSKTRDSPPSSIGRQAFRYPQESKATSRVMWEDPWDVLPFIYLHLSPVLCVVLVRLNIPVVSWGQLFWLVSSQLLVHPQSSRWWGRMRSRKRSWPCATLLSSNKNNCVLPIFAGTKSNLAPYLQLWRKLTLSQPKPAQKEKGTFKNYFNNY